MPASQDPGNTYIWARRIVDLFRQGKHVETITGSFTLTAGTSTAVAETQVLTTSKVVVVATNAAARGLGTVAVTAKTQGTGFTVTTAAAAGTETYDYIVFR